MPGANRAGSGSALPLLPRSACAPPSTKDTMKQIAVLLAVLVAVAIGAAAVVAGEADDSPGLQGLGLLLALGAVALGVRYVRRRRRASTRR